MLSNCLGLGLTVPVLQCKSWKRDMRFGTWTERSLCRLGSITTVATELARYKLDLVGVYVFTYIRGNRGYRKLYNEELNDL
jgi:hypothetical protein